MDALLLEDDGTTDSQSNAGDAQGAESQHGAGTQQGEGQQQNAQNAEAGAKQAEGGAEGEQQSETTVKIGGKDVPLSKAQKALEDLENNENWRDKNRRESEELNAERERLKRAAFIEQEISKRPELLQSIFSQKQPRNFDAEIAEHYSKRPDGIDQAEISAWEMKRDQINLERGQAFNDAKIESVRSIEEARIHNERLDDGAREKYVKSGKVTEDECARMAQWANQNLNMRSGKAPANAYDVAYRELFGDRFERDVRADATKRTTDPIKKATTGGADAGFTQRTPQASPEEAADNDFVGRVKDQAKGSYQKLS